MRGAGGMLQRGQGHVMGSNTNTQITMSHEVCCFRTMDSALDVLLNNLLKLMQPNIDYFRTMVASLISQTLV